MNTLFSFLQKVETKMEESSVFRSLILIVATFNYAAMAVSPFLIILLGDKTVYTWQKII